MDTPSAKTRLMSVVQTLVQRSFFRYLALFVVVGLALWLVFQYGSDLFKDETGSTLIWYQAGVAAAAALVISVGFYFSRLF